MSDFKWFILNEEGFLVTKLTTDPIELTHGFQKIPYSEKSEPQGLIKPRWNGRYWIEGMTQEEIQTENSMFKESLLQKVKLQAQRKINEILPLYKQFNLIREGKTDDVRFLRIDRIRSRSNEIESEIKSLTTRHQLINFKIEF